MNGLLQVHHDHLIRVTMIFIIIVIVNALDALQWFIWRVWSVLVVFCHVQFSILVKVIVLNDLNSTYMSVVTLNQNPWTSILLLYFERSSTRLKLRINNLKPVVVKQGTSRADYFQLKSFSESYLHHIRHCCILVGQF